MLIVQRKDAPNDGVAARVAAVEEALRELGAGAADGRCRGGAAFARAAALEQPRNERRAARIRARQLRKHLDHVQAECFCFAVALSVALAAAAHVQRGDYGDGAARRDEERGQHALEAAPDASQLRRRRRARLHERLRDVVAVRG